jgi:hypothetical protein
MERRYLVTALALALALAAITPTLGAQSQTHSVLASTDFPVRTAKAAKRIAKRARTIAYNARSTADAAQASAEGAVKTADEAKATAGQAKTAADGSAAELAGLRARSDTDAGTVTTDEENTFVDLGGPSVNLTVPASGLIEVWAQATISDGVVSLFEDGQQVPGQDPNDACSALADGLLSVEGVPSFTTSTPGTFGFTGCGGLGAPGSVLFKTSPGEHTYDLRYADCGCDPGDAEFVDRTLTVAPRP